MRLTTQLIEATESRGRTYSGKTLRAFGLPVPPPPGWKIDLIGREISREDYQRALDGRSDHYWQEQQENRQGQLF